jgi:hypothetical protein
VLHFHDPVAGFANLRRALAPNGKLGFVCARGPEHNPWATRPHQIVQSVLGPIPAPAVGKGPFALADDDHVRSTLRDAGFSKVSLEALDDPVFLGDDVDDVVEFFFETDLRKLDGRVNGDQALAIASALRTALSSWVTPTGIFAPAGGWLVTAEVC